MSRKRTTYSTELKTKLVLELLKEEKILVVPQGHFLTSFTADSEGK